MQNSWERIAGAYRQCLTIAIEDQPYLPQELTAYLAELLARLSNSYFGRENQFISEAYSTLASINQEVLGSLPSLGQLYEFHLPHTPTTVPSTDRRRPTIFEATIETMRRLRDLNTLEAGLAPCTLGAILGGSVSYGRFINVKGGQDASDLDFLVILEDWSHLQEGLDALSATPAVVVEDCMRASRRAQAFQRSSHMTDSCAFSTKIRMWGESAADPILSETNFAQEYPISLHFVTEQGAREIMLQDLDSIDLTSVPSERVFGDYRESAPVRGDNQRCFNGRRKSVQIEHKEHRGSSLRYTRIYFFENDHYFPGMFQNLILPAFDVRWGSTGIRRLTEAFRWKMIERLRYEQTTHTDELLRLSFAHTRSEVFAPHTVRAVDRSTTLA